MDWSKLTDNPADIETRKVLLKHLLSIRTVKEMSYTEYLKSLVKGKRVLDIGAAEHDLSHIKSPDWKHRIMRENCGYILGLDIVSDLVDYLSKQGYNFRCVDATTDIILGEYFDVVVIGDVIEHVDNPINLLKFAGRHISQHGEIIVTTPNPFYHRYFFRNMRKGTFVANFEHTCWVTPSMALEIARRSGLRLKSYICFRPEHKFQRLLSKVLSVETLVSSYTYVYGN
ncbi:MAG TPA: methyltransferase domain-containing protein [Thermodesulfovibrionales bacterium]|nr:methyltransferase domain-containing protein [Thermodesulfovibrionales bacterium]